ncbi:hypothetical protein OQ620_29130, partial [Klebsiella pneumoniae]|uniref:hypothetical protein n=1 Tax=Klebsiella pneumoniae TaxID=573 RepID=UPI002247A046
DRMLTRQAPIGLIAIAAIGITHERFDHAGGLTTLARPHRKGFGMATHAGPDVSCHDLQPALHRQGETAQTQGFMRITVP